MTREIFLYKSTTAEDKTRKGEAIVQITLDISFLLFLPSPFVFLFRLVLHHKHHQQQYNCYDEQKINKILPILELPYSCLPEVGNKLFSTFSWLGPSLHRCRSKTESLHKGPNFESFGGEKKAQVFYIIKYAI